MDSSKGRPCKDVRLLIGALIVKHKLTLSDEETVMQIQEIPYLQYFVGFSGYRDEPPFAPSLFLEIQETKPESSSAWDSGTAPISKEKPEVHLSFFG